MPLDDGGRGIAAPATWDGTIGSFWREVERHACTLERQSSRPVNGLVDSEGHGLYNVGLKGALRP